MKTNIDIATIITDTVALELGHFVRCCENRADTPHAKGSFYEGATAEDVKEMFLKAEWEPYTHSAIKHPATGFIAQWPGIMSVARLRDMDPETRIVLHDAHHGTAMHNDHFVEAEVVDYVSGTPVDFTTMLVGPRSSEDDKPIIWTWFPGDPINPSTVSAEGNHGKVIDARAALMLGMEWAKVVRPNRNVFTALVLDNESIRKLREQTPTPAGMVEKGQYVLLREGHAHSTKRDGRETPAFELGAEHSVTAHEIGFGDRVAAAKVLLPEVLEGPAKATSKIFAFGHVTLWRDQDVKPAKSKEIEVWKPIEPIRLTGRIMELPAG